MAKMTAEIYNRISAPFRKHPNSANRLERFNTVLTIITYVAYILLVAVQLLLMVQSMIRLADEVPFWEVLLQATFLRVLLVPAIGFAGVTIFRKKFNAKRPYQLLEIAPLLSKRKEGHSFPSRHVFCIFVIAMALGYVCVPLGIAFLALGVLLAIVRVIGGVHFPKDVIAGALIAIFWGLIGFYVIGATEGGLFVSVFA